MPGFSSFRIVPFEPQFHWEPGFSAAADRINRPHEDYPKYVPSTAEALQTLSNGIYWPANGWPSGADLLDLHGRIFQDDKPAQWREHDVMVGLHRPPNWAMVPRLMQELEWQYENLPITRENLEAWYVDFETIHPFGDGNGRVGGCVVALLCYALDWEEKRVLTPGD